MTAPETPARPRASARLVAQIAVLGAVFVLLAAVGAVATVTAGDRLLSAAGSAPDGGIPATDTVGDEREDAERPPAAAPTARPTPTATRAAGEPAEAPAASGSPGGTGGTGTTSPGPDTGSAPSAPAPADPAPAAESPAPSTPPAPPPAWTPDIAGKYAQFASTYPGTLAYVGTGHCIPRNYGFVQNGTFAPAFPYGVEGITAQVKITANADRQGYDVQWYVCE